MKFTETPLQGAFVLELQPQQDNRGFFSRAFCARELEAHGIKNTVAQANISFNHRKGTMRGMHYQVAPATETKLVRCTQGSLYDVIIDMRPHSPTYLRHFGIELSAKNHTALFVPDMFAHGFITLEDNTEAFYLVGEFYTPGCERGLRYNDPHFNIQWPATVEVISDKDAAWPDFKI